MMSAALKDGPANQPVAASSASCQSAWVFSCGSMKVCCALAAMPLTMGRTRPGARLGSWLKTSFSSRGGMAEPSA
ncbi:hypothetical protein D3C72_1181930 [compost metagenome]